LQFIVLAHELAFLGKHEAKSKKFYTEYAVISMLEFLIDSILVEFGQKIFKQIIGIQKETDCGSFCAALILL
jgi:hypothetical protein